MDKRAKERLEKLGVDISSEVKSFLEELAWKLELKEKVDELDKLVMKMPPTKKGWAERSVREDRESH